MEKGKPINKGKRERLPRQKGKRERRGRVVFELPFDPYIQNRASLARTKRNDFPVAGGCLKADSLPQTSDIYIAYRIAHWIAHWITGA